MSLESRYVSLTTLVQLDAIDASSGLSRAATLIAQNRIDPFEELVLEPSHEASCERVFRAQLWVSFENLLDIAEDVLWYEV